VAVAVAVAVIVLVETSLGSRHDTVNSYLRSLKKLSTFFMISIIILGTHSRTQV
jgi:hypothetical protein